MRIPGGLTSSLDFSTVDPDLIAAKFYVLARQVPMLYAVYCSAGIALMISFYGTLPTWQLSLLLVFLISVAIVRSWSWIALARRPYDASLAVAKLREISVMASGLGVFMLVAVVWLFPAGNAYQRSHIVLNMMISANACIFFLFSVKRPAFFSVLFMLLSIVFMVFVDPNRSLIAMQGGVVLTLVIIMFALGKQDDELADLIRTRRALKLKQAQTEALALDNHKLAMEDPLTGIANRRQFLADLEQTRDTAHSQGVSHAIALINVDGFKSINSVYGYRNGDQLLCAIAQRLKECAGSDSHVARMSGDEFAVLCAGKTSTDRLLQETRELCLKMAQPFALPGLTIHLGASAGLAVFDAEHDSQDDAMEQASYALHLAKRTNRGGAVLFSEAYRSDFRYKSQLEQALKSGEWRSEMYVVFQPVMSFVSSEVEGFEALARWESLQFGSVPPDVFIEIAERCGLIAELTDALLEMAARAALAWPEKQRLLFNLSASDISRPGLANRIAAVLQGVGLPAERLEVEVTETSLMQDFVQARATIEQLKAMGIRVALDDFGTGFSNLAQLQHMAPDLIKIDRNFIVDIETNALNRNIVTSMISLARSLGCQWVVEGLETEGQVRLLADMGTDLMQGFFFSRPLDAERAGRFAINGLPPALLEALR